ncbi:MAG: DegT/DnrJ/EryC1/StrS family aminotransferase [Geminicoccaceae bacterium]
MVALTKERLAIDGGTPVVAAGEIEERWPIVEEEDIEAVVAVLRSGRLSWMNNDEIPALEADWASYVGSRHCIAMNSGTSALHAAVAASGVGPGDEVIVPALSFLASATAVIHHQGLPVFVDIDPFTFNIDPAAIEAQITPRTKAIVAVHLHGLPADMDPIMEIAKRHGLKVIEDMAQAQGALYKDRRAGALGDMAACSIMAGKNLATAGEGGLFTTNDPEIRDRADMVKMFGERLSADTPREYNATTMGWNYRFSAPLAAFTRMQLGRLDSYNARVQAGAERLAERLEALPGLNPPYVPLDRSHVYHHFRLRVDPAAAGLDIPTGRFRKAVQDLLAAEGVALIEYQNRPLPGQTLFQQRQGYGQGCPWSCGKASRDIVYRESDYPQTLDVIRSSLLVGKRLCMASFMQPSNLERYADAFERVFAQPDRLADYALKLDYREPWEMAERLW